MTSPPLSTRTKNVLNNALGRLNLKISTTRADQAERARLDTLTRLGHWNEPRYGCGLHLESDLYRAFLHDVCAPYRSGYACLQSTNPGGFAFGNHYFERVDAEVLYSVIRHLRPARMVEVGSGNSTRIARSAISHGALSTVIISIDPNPRVTLDGVTDQHIAAEVQQLDPKTLAGMLSPGDILFIDSSHVVRTGSDVPFLYLEVLPRLQPGVIIHIHDIFLPYDYPEGPVLRGEWDCNEQYLVHALLMNNPSVEVLFPAYFMWRHYRDDIQAVIPDPTYTGALGPGSFWLRTRQKDATRGL